MSTQTADAATTPQARRGREFRYEAYRIDPGSGLLSCRYSVDGRPFGERVTFHPMGQAHWDSPAVAAAARLVFLLAGVSSYKTAAPPVINTGEIALTPREREFLRAFYTDGLGEFAYRNGIDLSGLRIEGPTAPETGAPETGLRRKPVRRPGAKPVRRKPVRRKPVRRRPAATGESLRRKPVPAGKPLCRPPAARPRDRPHLASLVRSSLSAAVSTPSSPSSWSASTLTWRCSSSAGPVTVSTRSSGPRPSPGSRWPGPSVRSTRSCCARVSSGSSTGTYR